MAGQNRLPSDHGLQAFRKRFKFFFPSMDSSGPSEPPPPTPPPPSRLAGLAGVVACRAATLGLLGGHSRGASELEHFEASDGQSIPVRIVGDGPPVLLVHGLGCSHRHSMPVARRLARRHRVRVGRARPRACAGPVASAVSLVRLGQDHAEPARPFRPGAGDARGPLDGCADDHAVPARPRHGARRRRRASSINRRARPPTTNGAWACSVAAALRCCRA